jgi:hypothetical protein
MMKYIIWILFLSSIGFSGITPTPIADKTGAGLTSTNNGGKQSLDVNVTSTGGGGGADVQYVDGVTQITPTGTAAFGKNSSNILHALALDASGNLNVNLAAGSISGGNAAASLTGAAVPTSADYTGFNSGGNLIGVSSSNPLPVVQTGTSSLPTGASTSALQTTINTTLGSPFQAGGSIGNTAFIANAGANLNTSLLQLDATGAKLNNAQASTTSGQTGPLIQGAVTTAAPTYTTAQTSPLSLTTAGALRTDASGSTQPISGTITSNIGTTNGLALDASLTTLNTSVNTLLKPASTLAAVTTLGSITSALPTGANIIGALTANQSVNVAQINGVAPLMGNGVTGTGSQRVTIASDNTAFATNATLSAETTKVIGTVNVAAAQTIAVTQATAANLNAAVVGTKTNNNAAPGATNIGTLPVLANAAPPTWVEGNLVNHSADLAGNLRTYSHPTNALGYYSVSGNTGTYTALATLAPLVSFRWGSATGLAVILKVEIQVVTTTAATVAATNERQLIIARSFTVADTGGTAIVLTGNNNKRRTSQATSLVSDLRSGGPLTAGTRTLDANPVSVAWGWSGLLSTGTVIGGAGASAVGAARSVDGGAGFVKLLDATNGQDYPIVLAQNEGIIIRIGAAQPTTAANTTYWTITWAEVNSY